MMTFKITLQGYTFPKTYQWDFAAEVFVATNPSSWTKSTINDPNIIHPDGNLGRGFNVDGSIIWHDEGEGLDAMF